MALRSALNMLYMEFPSAGCQTMTKSNILEPSTQTLKNHKSVSLVGHELEFYCKLLSEVGYVAGSIKCIFRADL